MKASHLLLIVSLFAFTISRTFAGSDSAAIEKLHAIPPADPNFEKGPGSINVPVLILTARGACLNYALSGKRIPFDQVLQALAALPKSAWGHGRCLMFFPYAPSVHYSVDDPPPPDSVVKKVLDALKSADIKVNQNGVST
jgi:hypothetical protein